ncbi:hypothetical protein E1A91_1Z019700v1 [Gossypium mustelinum]|uniref:Uncharacterized protein n=1 Tax=Gossypium mustelinum TaxID=34275 RepID=A0A5C7J325_GOSMU|nr:hypothetical protein E1A91_1Z019700v1 [Gossypium mustelinum]
MRLLIFTYNRNFVILGGEEGFQMLVDALVWDSDALSCCILHHVPSTGHACLWAEKVFNQDTFFKKTVKYVGEPMTHLEST